MYRATPLQPPSLPGARDDTFRGTPGGRLLTSLLFLLVFFYFWVGIDPFPNPNAASLTSAYGSSSNKFNQIIVVLMTGTLLVTVLVNEGGSLLLRPRSLLVLILIWYTFAALFSLDPGTALRRIVFSVLVCLCGSAILLLPRSRDHFASLMCYGVLAVIAIAYFGVAVWPHIAIHQLTDALEQSLAGDWRGHYGHKNAAAAAMVYAVFVGLYVMRSKSMILGAFITVFAALFLWKTGSKTSAAMLPAVLVAGWVFERSAALRPLVIIGVLAAVNTLLMSAAASTSVQDLLQSVGIDPTFTDRASIWGLALQAIANSPLTGYGFQSFWQTDALFRSSYSLYTWAVTAANSHNGYVEQLINGGIPALLLTLVWLVVLPIAYSGRALQSGNDLHLTRMFLRIWIYSLYLACLESPFYGNTGPIWFMMLIAIFGLRLQSSAYLIEGQTERPRQPERYRAATNAR